MSSKSPRSKKATGPSGTQSHPYTRGYQKALDQFPNLAVTSAEEAASLQVTSEMSGMPMSGMSLSYLYRLRFDNPDLKDFFTAASSIWHTSLPGWRMR